MRRVYSKAWKPGLPRPDLSRPVCEGHRRPNRLRLDENLDHGGQLLPSVDDEVPAQLRLGRPSGYALESCCCCTWVVGLNSRVFRI